MWQTSGGMPRSALFACFLTVAACASSTSSGTDPGTGYVAEDAGVSTAPKGTWTYVYSTYFGPKTPGHCGNSGCHANTRSSFRCGTTQDDCYKGLLSSGLVDPAKGEASTLADPATSPVIWFSTRGGMPRDNRKANEAAAADVREWLAAGAPND
jgi:hypothetical protein